MLRYLYYGLYYLVFSVLLFFAGTIGLIVLIPVYHHWHKGNTWWQCSKSAIYNLWWGSYEL